MIRSVRTIASGVVAISVVALTFSFSSVMIARCISGENCAAAVSLYRDTPVNETNPAYSGSTPTILAAQDSSMIFNTIVEYIQVTASYGLIVGVIVLIALETQELHYLKRLSIRRRRA